MHPIPISRKNHPAACISFTSLSDIFHPSLHTKGVVVNDTKAHAQTYTTMIAFNKYHVNNYQFDIHSTNSTGPGDLRNDHISFAVYWMKDCIISMREPGKVPGRT